MSRTLKLLLALGVALTLLVGLGPATAAQYARTTVEITKATGDAENVQVKGTVSSPKDRCIDNRKVLVYHDVAPEGRSANDFKLGSTRAAANGKWDFASVALPDKVIAVVKKKRKLKCRGDVSPTVVVDYK